MGQPWTNTADIEARWRPLSEDEAERAPGIIGIIERGIARRWTDVQARLDADTLKPDDLKDVVALLARQVLEVDPDIPLRAKAWQQTSGTESESITLDGSLAGAMLTFDDWMVEALDSPIDAAATAIDTVPLFHAPQPSKRLHNALRENDEWWDWYDLMGRLE
jgi:hypothetical protein